VSDGLEGFARTFLIAASLVAGREGEDPGGWLQRYSEGLTAGTDPAAADCDRRTPNSWPPSCRPPYA
jgi:hypothetical protein